MCCCLTNCSPTYCNGQLNSLPPDRTYDNYRAAKYVDRRISCSSETSMDGFWCSKIAKFSVGRRSVISWKSAISRGEKNSEKGVHGMKPEQREFSNAPGTIYWTKSCKKVRTNSADSLLRNEYNRSEGGGEQKTSRNPWQLAIATYGKKAARSGKRQNWVRKGPRHCLTK